MKRKTKEEVKSHLRSLLYGKRGYYFHADEDFREDYEWGKSKSGNSKVSTLSDRITPNA